MTAEQQSQTTRPKPFVFVLMPLDPDFDDIYKFGIKGAAAEVGAYAERVDEQAFTEGILERIYNQISKADVIVADMTDRNPNVFYEVGYAHALGKIVLLLTQRADDIPFDLKHRQHIVYSGKIDTLRQQLSPKLTWAITEGRARAQSRAAERFTVRLEGIELSLAADKAEPPMLAARAPEQFSVALQLRNDSLDVSAAISHVYLFASPDSALVPCAHRGVMHSDWGGVVFSTMYKQEPTSLQLLSPDPSDVADGLSSQYRLNVAFPALPPSAIESTSVSFMFRSPPREAADTYRLRLISSSGVLDYKFRMKIGYQKESDSAGGSTPQSPASTSS